MHSKAAADRWACVDGSPPAARLLLLHLCHTCLQMAPSSSMHTVQRPVEPTCMGVLWPPAHPEADATCLLSAGCGAWCMELM